MIGILVPITGVIINYKTLTKETIDKWAKFYAVGITVGMMYTAVGVVIVFLSAILGAPG